MKKDCFLIFTNPKNSISIYISKDAWDDFGKFILRNEKKCEKLNYVVKCLCANSANRKIYQEYKDYPGTAAFKLGRGENNLRIYCKVEKIAIENSFQKRITISTIFNKRVQELGKKEIGYLKAIQQTEYKYGGIIDIST